jgi:acetolactate synthase-1/3 small subunit
VLEIEDLTEVPRISLELALVKLAVSGAGREAALAAVRELGGRVVDDHPEQLIVELSGEYQRVESALKALQPFRVVDLARSGPVAISKKVAIGEPQSSWRSPAGGFAQ